MAEALVEVSTLSFSPEDFKNQDWIAKGEMIKFDGFMKLYIEGSDDEAEEGDDVLLPELKK